MYRGRSYSSRPTPGLPSTAGCPSQRGSDPADGTAAPPAHPSRQRPCGSGHTGCGQASGAHHRHPAETGGPSVPDGYPCFFPGEVAEKKGPPWKEMPWSASEGTAQTVPGWKRGYGSRCFPCGAVEEETLPHPDGCKGSSRSGEPAAYSPARRPERWGLSRRSGWIG